MRKIILTQELVKEYFDYCEYGYLTRKIRTSNRIHIGDKFGGISNHGYRRGTFLGNLVLEHRLIYLYHHGYIPNEIDHINRIRSDNRIENLRESVNYGNQCNIKKRIDNKTGYKGVSYYKARDNYSAEISKNKKKHFLGYFDSPKEAHEAYCIAAKRLHGEFACTD